MAADNRGVKAALGRRDRGRVCGRMAVGSRNLLQRSIRNGSFSVRVRHAWTVANGDGPRDHPAIRRLNLPKLWNPGRASPLITKTLVFLGEGGNNAIVATARCSAPATRKMATSCGRWSCPEERRARLCRISCDGKQYYRRRHQLQKRGGGADRADAAVGHRAVSVPGQCVSSRSAPTPTVPPRSAPLPSSRPGGRTAPSRAYRPAPAWVSSRPRSSCGWPR